MSELYEIYKEFPNSIKASMFVTIVLIVFSIIIGRKAKKADPLKPPTGMFFVVYTLTVILSDYMASLVGSKRARKFTAYLLMVSLYITLSIVVGLFGFASPLLHPVVTVSLGLMTFTFMTVGAIAYNGMSGYLKDFLDPIFLFLPVNIIGEFAKPFSLGIRLFANILAGVIIMTLLYSVLGYAALVIAPVGHVIFDIIFGAIQVLVFTLLSAIFIGLAVGNPEEEMN